MSISVFFRRAGCGRVVYEFCDKMCMKYGWIDYLLHVTRNSMRKSREKGFGRGPDLTGSLFLLCPVVATSSSCLKDVLIGRYRNILETPKHNPVTPIPW